ncbi:rRNA pseudouridine synthase [Myxococcota bacterium]|nr:rRNA pseudouridine synthase [Myxococcota bacterium]
MNLLRLLANLGYGSRREVEQLLRRGRVTGPDGAALRVGDADPGGALWVDGQPLDPRPPLVVALHKPVGLVCSTSDGDGPTVYTCLPPRFAARQPVLAPVGRLDKDSSGLLLLTDDGALLHHLTSPRRHVPKVYRATLADPVRGDEVGALAGGGLLLRGEQRPLLPARVEVLDPHTVRVEVTEGRYHLVRRMWAALGNRVRTLHREQVGPLTLTGLEAPGAWRVLEPAEVRALRAPAEVTHA